MKIEALHSENRDNRVRISATVSWEDCDRPVEEIYFETEEEFAEGLSCNPHAFLVGCIIPAMHYGEKRLSIEAEICPELRQGLITAMSWLRHWYYDPNRELVRIEARTQSRPPTSPNPERAGFFFSGGIDSFATLRTNRLNFPLEHPGSIKDGILVYGLELDDIQAFGYVKEALSEVAEEARINLIPVYTNVYLPYRDDDVKNNFRFWINQFMGAALAAVAHVLSRRLTTVAISAGLNIPALRPHGSDPRIDPNYSSYDMRIRHEGLELSRLTKTRLIAGWDSALQNLRVCNQFRRYGQGRLNCGRCEKCLRTMMALLALGALERTAAFPGNDISEREVLEAVYIDNSYTEYCYRELITPLIERGRYDLVRAINASIARAKRNVRFVVWKKMIKQLDSKHLGGSLHRLRRLVSRQAS